MRLHDCRHWHAKQLVASSVDLNTIAEKTFGLSIFLLVISLLFSLYEIVISTKAIEIELEDLEIKSRKA